MLGVIKGAITGILKKVVIAAVSEAVLKKVVISLLKEGAKKTEWEMDDQIVSEIEKALK